MSGEANQMIDQLFAEAERIEKERGVSLALEFFEQCLGQVRHQFGDDSLAAAAVLNQMGFVNRSNGYCREAADYFAQAREVLARAVGTNSPEYATAVMNLAGAQRLLGNLPASLQSFEEALGVYEAAYGEESVMYLTALNNIALVYQDMGENSWALRCHLQVCFGLEQLSERDGGLMVEYGTSLCNTGVCFRLEGEERTGRQLIEQALEVYATLLPDDHFLVRQARQMLESKVSVASVGEEHSEVAGDVEAMSYEGA